MQGGAGICQYVEVFFDLICSKQTEVEQTEVDNMLSMMISSNNPRLHMCTCTYRPASTKRAKRSIDG